MPRNREFKAVQMGGPSGGCVPAAHLDLPIDYDSLKEVGAIMGSGGMIVMDNTTCIVDIARYFISFCAEESCGLCAPCRLGTVKLEETLNRITGGKGTLEDLDQLESLGEVVQQTSLCGLGQTAPNPVMSTLRHFRDEYLAHVVDKTCPAGVCTALLPVEETARKEK
jgi:NADH:ubiquinone oxidoreductase subunit F (NADH-binding)